MGEMAEYYSDWHLEENLNSTESFRKKEQKRIDLKKATFKSRLSSEDGVFDFYGNLREGKAIHKAQDNTLYNIRIEDKDEVIFATMSDNHLINTINLILRVTKGGVEQNYGWEDGDVWYVSEEEARQNVGLHLYTEEATKRKLTWGENIEPISITL